MSGEIAVAAEWDKNAPDWAANLRAGNDRINDSFGIPCFLDELGEIKGLDVLDAGCGEGRSSRHLARKGAKVTGVDISAAMIAQAKSRETEEPYGIDFKLASCADLKMFPDARFDLVTSFMALMDTPQLVAVLGEFHRVVKPGGKIAIAIRHPCHFTPGFSIIRTPGGEPGALSVAAYHGAKPYGEHWRFPGQKTGGFNVTRFPYRLADYAEAIIQAGFSLSALREPRPTEDMCKHLPSLNFWRLHGALYLFLFGSK